MNGKKNILAFGKENANVWGPDGKSGPAMTQDPFGLNNGLHVSPELGVMNVRRIAGRHLMVPLTITVIDLVESIA